MLHIQVVSELNIFLSLSMTCQCNHVAAVLKPVIIIIIIIIIVVFVVVIIISCYVL